MRVDLKILTDNAPKISPNTIGYTADQKYVDATIFGRRPCQLPRAHSLELLWEWGRWGVERIEAFPLAPSYLNFQCDEVAMLEPRNGHRNRGHSPGLSAIKHKSKSSLWIGASCGGPFQRRTRKKRRRKKKEMICAAHGTTHTGGGLSWGTHVLATILDRYVYGEVKRWPSLEFENRVAMSTNDWLHHNHWFGESCSNY